MDEVTSNIDFQFLFNLAPDLYLVLFPDLKIAAVNDAYLQATMTKRQEIIGKDLFHVFPDNPEDKLADGVSNLRSSLETVIRYKREHRMPTQKYDIKKPDGSFEVRYWSPLNKPVLNENNELKFIIHSVEDITDQYFMDMRNKTAELLLQSSIESLTDTLIFSIDKNFRYLNFNSAHKKATQAAYGIEIDIGMSLLSHVTNESDIQKIKSNFTKAFQGVSHITIEEFGDVEHFYFETRYNPIINDFGEIIGATVFSHNISERKRTEEQIKEIHEKLGRSNELFSKLFDLNPAAMSMSKLSDQTFYNVNQSFLDLFGFENKEEVIGKTAEEHNLFTEDTLRYKMVENVRKNGKESGIEGKVKTKTGIEKWVSASAQVIEISNEFYLLTVFLDITARKEQEELVANQSKKLKIINDELKSSNELFSKLFELNPAPILITRLQDATILDVNQSFLQMFEFDSKNEVLDKTAHQIKILVNTSKRDMIVEELLQNKRVVNIEDQYQTKKGNLKWASSSVQLIDIAGTPCLLSVMLDITQKIEDEKQLKKQKEELMLVNRELESFSYSVSHDLKAPLRSLQGFSRTLLENYKGKFDDDADRWLHFIESNAKRMDELIQDILNFSKVSRADLTVAPVNMHQMVQDIFYFEKSAYPSKKIDLKLGELPFQESDGSMIRQVWQNLISNALKYSSKNERIEININSYAEDGFIVYSISDNGVGFDDKYKEKLFGVFQRLHSNDEFDGTGVGLAIVKRIIQKHDGWITANSALGKGAEFKFALPTKNLKI